MEELIEPVHPGELTVELREAVPPVVDGAGR